MKLLTPLLALVAAASAPLAATTSSTPSFIVLSTAAPETQGSVPVELDKSAKSSSYSKVRVTTVNGSAIAGVDFVAVDQVVTVANSKLVVTVPVQLVARPGYQGTRQFTVHLAIVRNGTIASNNATITIIDSDSPPPPPPATKTCPDGSVVAATSTCPAPPPPPASVTSWVPSGQPVQVGGYVFLKGSTPSQQCCTGLIMRVTGRWYDADGHALPMFSAVYAADPSGNYPASNPYWATHEGGVNEDSVIAVAPAG